MTNHFRSYNDLINVLAINNLEFKDKDRAKHLIQEKTYYSLINGFKAPFIDHTTHKFQPGTSFEDIYFQYNLEQQLKNIILEYLLKIETRYKEVIGHLLGEQYGDTFDAYMDVNNFSGRMTWLLDEIEYFTNERDKLLTRRNITPTKYYNDTKNFLPPWIFLHDLTFKPVNSIFKMLKYNLKRDVISYMLYDSMDFGSLFSQPAIEMFSYSMSLIVEYRNLLAHNSRIYRGKVNLYEAVNYSILTLFIDDSCISEDEFNNGLGNCDFFGLLCLTKVLSNSSDGTMFVANIAAIFDNHLTANPALTRSYFDSLNLPADFISRLITLNNKI